MSRHIVSSFERMSVRKGFRRDLVQGHVQIARNVGIGVFIDTDRRRRVLQKKVHHTGPDFPQLRNRLEDLPGDRVNPGGVGRKRQLFLCPVHGNKSLN